MHIALVTDGIWPYVLGGMQKHSYYLCKYLAQSKIKVDLYHYNQSEYNIEELEFFTASEKEYIQSIIVEFPKPLSFPGHYVYESYQYSKNVFEAIKGNLKNYTFIYTKGFSGWYLINQKYKGYVSCAPIGVKFHGYEMFQKAPNFKTYIQNLLFLKQPVKSISLKADVVYSYGGKITELIKSIGVTNAQIFELPSGVEENFVTKNSRATQGKIKIVYLGRYERRKGIEELNQAILSFYENEKKSNIEFHFVGPIPDDKKLNSTSVFYHGEIRDKTQLISKLQVCDILICPSWSEGMPNVILEGMANGLAIIATDVGATRIMVNAANGWLLPEPKVELLLTLFLEINKLTSKDLEVKKLNALNLIKEQFIWEKLIHKLVEQFKQFK